MLAPWRLLLAEKYALFVRCFVSIHDRLTSPFFTSQYVIRRGLSGIEFVEVGVSGIKFYARTPADAFATLDLGALLAPAAENLRVALSVLSGPKPACNSSSWAARPRRLMVQRA